MTCAQTQVFLPKWTHLVAPQERRRFPSVGPETSASFCFSDAPGTVNGFTCALPRPPRSNHTNHDAHFTDATTEAQRNAGLRLPSGEWRVHRSSASAGTLSATTHSVSAYLPSRPLSAPGMHEMVTLRHAPWFPQLPG